MDFPEKRVVDFIHEHHLLSLSTCSVNKPWSASCFYAYLEDENCFVFTSDEDTRHVRDALVNDSVAGTIALETKIVGKIRGIQFRGKMFLPEAKLKLKIRRAYLKRFPYAVLMKTKLWVVKPDYIKMTDNRLGFGKKIIWESLTGNSRRV